MFLHKTLTKEIFVIADNVLECPKISYHIKFTIYILAYYSFLRECEESRYWVLLKKYWLEQLFLSERR